MTKLYLRLKQGTNNECRISSLENTVNLGNIGPLLGFLPNTVIQRGLTKDSGQVSINQGLESLVISSSLVDDQDVFDSSGEHSQVVAVLPIDTTQRLNSTMTNYGQLEFSAPIFNGNIRQFTITVGDNLVRTAVKLHLFAECEIKNSEEELFLKEQELRELYYDPVRVYQSAQKLYETAKEEGIGVTLAQVREWLRGQETYVRFQQPAKGFNRRQTWVPQVGSQLQMDLVDMSKYEAENEDHLWILTAIGVFSRYFFAIPLQRKHKGFTLVAVKRVLYQYKERFGKLPDFVQFDDGGEFRNTRVLPFLGDKGITYFSTRLTSKKASVVERANRTLKTRMWKFFDHEGSKEWIYVLDDLVEGINSSVNGAIGMAPNQVTEKTSASVFVKLYGHPVTLVKPKFGVGDKVHVTKYASTLADPGKRTFRKGYKASFSKETYQVTRVCRGEPNLYSIEDERAHPVFGRMYSKELTKVSG